MSLNQTIREQNQETGFIDEARGRKADKREKQVIIQGAFFFQGRSIIQFAENITFRN